MQLCQQPRVCLTESEEVPQDWTTLFQTKRNKIISSWLLKEINNALATQYNQIKFYSFQLGYEFGAEDTGIIPASRSQAREFKTHSAAVRNSVTWFTSLLHFVNLVDLKYLSNSHHYQLKVAVFPPLFRTLHAPPLELYDLDAEFSSEKNRLSQLTNRCNDSDLEYYIIEAGHILNIIPQLKLSGNNTERAKQIIHHVVERISQFKKSNPIIWNVKHTTL